MHTGGGQVRKLLLSWPRSWANFSLLQLYAHRNAWANLHFLGQPDTVLAREVVTCAHVVDARDDDAMEEGDIPARLGRCKLLMFASGRARRGPCCHARTTPRPRSAICVVNLYG